MLKHRRHFHNLNGGYIANNQRTFGLQQGIWCIGITNTDIVQQPVGEFFEDFESGLLDSAWTTVNNWAVDSAQANSGTFSGVFTGASNSIEAVWSPSPISAGNEVTLLEYYYYETGSSSGSVVVFRDSGGTVVLGTGTNNPQWNIYVGPTAGWEQIYGGDGTGRWVRVTLDNFNWSTGDFDFEWEDTSSGHIETGTRTMETVTDIASIEMSPTNLDQPANPVNSGSSAANNSWVDDLKVIRGSSPAPTELNFAQLRALGVDRIWANNPTITGSSLGQAALYGRTIGKNRP